jgi:AcrR family transcriptional regulator
VPPGSGRSTPPPWFDAGPPVRTSITARTIVEAAHRLVHEGGPEALTLRSLAADLGIGSSAIYRRIGDKEHLLVAVADFVLAGVRIDDLTDARPWRANLRTLGMRLREVLAAHPHVHPVLDTYLLATPSTTRVATVAIESIGRAGLPRAEIVDAYNAWICYVLGFGMLEYQPGPGETDRSRASVWIRDQLDTVDAAASPTLARVRGAMANHAVGFRWDVTPLGPRGTSFRYGLDILLDGLAARADRREH